MNSLKIETLLLSKTLRFFAASRLCVRNYAHPGPLTCTCRARNCDQLTGGHKSETFSVSFQGNGSKPVDTTPALRNRPAEMVNWWNVRNRLPIHS
jgi:hypothetical protein